MPPPDNTVVTVRLRTLLEETRKPGSTPPSTTADEASDAAVCSGGSEPMLGPRGLADRLAPCFPTNVPGLDSDTVVALLESGDDASVVTVTRAICSATAKHVQTLLHSSETALGKAVRHASRLDLQRTDSVYLRFLEDVRNPPPSNLRELSETARKLCADVW